MKSFLLAITASLALIIVAGCASSTHFPDYSHGYYTNHPHSKFHH